MPEASAQGITKTALRQAAPAPWKVHPVSEAGVSYTQSEVLNWVQVVTDRNDA